MRNQRPRKVSAKEFGFQKKKLGMLEIKNSSESDLKKCTQWKESTIGSTKQKKKNAELGNKVSDNHKGEQSSHHP